MNTAKSKMGHATGSGPAARGVGLLATACLLTLALVADAGAQSTTTTFDTPAAFARAAGSQAYAVSTSICAARGSARAHRDGHGPGRDGRARPRGQPVSGSASSGGRHRDLQRYAETHRMASASSPL